MRLRSSSSRRTGSTGGIIAEAADSPIVDQRIGAILERQGYLSEDDIEQIARQQGENGHLFGEAAVAAGKLTPEQRDRALAQQGDAGALSPEDNLLDPMLVAAFNLNDSYVNRVRAIRSRILQHRPDARAVEMYSCAFIGLDCPEEVSVMAANLAIVMARLGDPTLLVDAGLHRARQHELFRVPNRRGFSSLRPDVDLDEAVQDTAIRNLWLIPAGPGQPDEILALEREPALGLVEQWQVPSTQLLLSMPLRSADYIPTLGTTLAGFDSAVILVRKHVTAIDNMRSAIDQLDEKGIAILGTVIV